MKTNYKKPIKVQNNTHYFEPTKTKVQNTFVNPRTFWARKNKIEGYENRLYWEWKYCTDHNGQTFFYTLTYNNKNVPKYNGQNCFDYEDLRKLLNGGLSKKLLREYGTKFKYFVGAELGEGKGTRKNKNNPHYHILFFLRSAENKEYPYIKIQPLQFRSLIRYYWQGVDQDIEGYTNYKDFKKGIIKEGENLGLVTDYRAISYCAKYVTKDIGLIKREENIKQEIRKEWHKKIYTCAESYERFWEEYILPKYNIPKECSTEEKKEYKWNTKQIADQFGVKELGNLKFENEWTDYCFATIQKFGLQKQFYEECNKYLDEKIKAKINEYRNRYCNKCRISHGVGDYALETKIDTNKPKIGIYNKYGYQERNINLYYYRKIYCDIVKDPLGNNKYILNEKGIEYNINKLKDKIEKLKDETLANLSVLTEEIAEDMLKSNINTECILNWYDIKALKQNEEKDTIAERYSIFKLVYEGRFYKIENNRHPKIDPYNDFRNFLQPDYNTTNYDIDPVNMFLQNMDQNFMAYNTHPYFLQDMQFYTLFDTITDYLFIKMDNQKEKENENLKKTKQFHKSREFQNYLNNLK